MSNKTEILLFELNNKKEYAVEVSKVKEIIMCPQINKVSNGKSLIKGLITVRNQSIPVIDLSETVGFEKTNTYENKYVIIVEEEKLGLIVNKVDKIINLKEKNNNETNNNKKHFIDYIAKNEDKLIQVININKVKEKINE